MKYRRYIRIMELLIVVILITLILVEFIGTLTALIIMIAIQFIIGNVVYPLIYKQHFDKFVIVTKSYNTSFNEQVYSKQKLVVESKVIYDKFYIFLYRFLVGTLTVVFIFYGTMFLLGKHENLISYPILIGLYVLAPIFLYMIRKLLSFPCSFNQNELSGNFKTTLDYSVRFKKEKIDLSNVTSMSFIENKLIDPMKYITVIEFVLKDDTRMYFNILFYSRRNRDKILDTLKKSLTQDDK